MKGGLRSSACGDIQCRNVSFLRTNPRSKITGNRQRRNSYTLSHCERLMGSERLHEMPLLHEMRQ
jgi:hypothetical protein